ncbi:MAG: glycosyltransferase family 39 protein [Reyranella sp.]|uniref:ArnT family glycosyltransferase n=1 Tax=Reyranella sp. TaxID=1929291 RepID=UPI00272EF473|nr:glycosyltransferase family 39 protein [Reyranella sp.]MDP1961185.1 glycosyltransferase family 39 protein [Reyranella sp.]MDP2378682.1 glycosyltransferase family 39 protein [Reyranella sp.]
MRMLPTLRRSELAALAGVLLIATALRLWDLDANGFGNEYYAAGVRSMLQGARLFFYNAFDPAGLVSLDKPPLAFWIQTASAAVLGYGGWSIHLPQALAGVASVVLLYGLVRRPFGRIAAFFAALLLAVSPVTVAADRSNNADSWLVLFLLIAAALAMRGRGLSFVLAMVALGLAFNVKMLAALVCGPALLVGWWLASTLDWRQRLAWLTAGGVTLTIVALSWAIAFDLTPRDSRPQAGSSKGDSMLELIVVHNGLERFARDRPETPIFSSPAYDAAPVGPLRLATPMLAAQFAWALPLALLGAVLAWRRSAWVALWAGWALAYAVVYSAAGGIFHIYYLATLAPPLAALAGVGCYELWRRGPGYLALGLAATALWQGYLTGTTLGWTSSWIGFPGVALLAGAAAWWRAKRPPAIIGGVALLVLPAAWVLSPVFSPGSLTLPSASLPRWLGVDDGRGPILSRHFRSLTDDPKLLAYLQAQRGSARFLAATPTALLAAPIIIRTGGPALPFGGYLGNDPIMSVEAFAERVRRGEVRYVVLGTARLPADFDVWVRTHGVSVDPALWRSQPPEPRRAIALYDLAPRQPVR